MAGLPCAVKELVKKPYQLASRSTLAKDSQFEIGNVVFGGSVPIVNAGPCSVESREQVMACARVVKEWGGQLPRGGCFKPRTSPYALQGLGYDFDMLDEAGQAYGLPIVTEVMHPSDLVKELSHLPVIVEPSHACGIWRWVPAMTEAALACGAHGVMVEIHPEPAKALSDGPQALDFDVFRRLMQRLPNAPPLCV